VFGIIPIINSDVTAQGSVPNEKHGVAVCYSLGDVPLSKRKAQRISYR
jgi:hypothetical protein